MRLTNIMINAPGSWAVGGGREKDRVMVYQRLAACLYHHERGPREGIRMFGERGI